MTESIKNQTQISPSLPHLKTTSVNKTQKREMDTQLIDIQYDPEEAFNLPMDKLRESIDEIIQDFRHLAHAYNKRLDFNLDSESGEIVVKIIDKSTDKVIKEVPPKELLKVHARIRQAMGLLFDELI